MFAESSVMEAGDWVSVDGVAPGDGDVMSAAVVAVGAVVGTMVGDAVAKPRFRFSCVKPVSAWVTFSSSRFASEYAPRAK